MLPFSNLLLSVVVSRSKDEEALYESILRVRKFFVEFNLSGYLLDYDLALNHGKSGAYFTTFGRKLFYLLFKFQS